MLNYFLKKSREASVSDDREIEIQPPSYRPASPPAESEEVRMRRLMEALWVPTAPTFSREIVRPIQTPTRAVRPGVQYSQPKAVGSDLKKRGDGRREGMIGDRGEGATATFGEVRSEGVSTPRKPDFMQLTSIGGGFSTDQGALVKPVSSGVTLNMKGLIRDRESLRKGVLLREILGSPRGIEGYL